MISDRETHGGAAVAASRLATALSERNHQIFRLVFSPENGHLGWTTVKEEDPTAIGSFVLRVRNRLSGRSRVWLNDYIERRDMEKLLRRIQPDVVNVHNLAEAISSSGWSLSMLEAAKAHCPVVWTLHDQWSFTGRCTYAFGCEKFLTGCDHHCPTPEEHPALAPEKINAAYQTKKLLLEDGHQPVAVSPSRWLAQEASRGLWRKSRVEIIPNGIPTQVFRPQNRFEVRQELGFPLDRPILLAVAESLSGKRKGGPQLKEAWEILDGTGLFLVLLGHSKRLQLGDMTHVKALGFVNNPATLTKIYAAADVLIHPAIADNLPNVILEAMSCGTPTVGFPIGGVPDMVRPGETGWLAEEASGCSLARVVKLAVDENFGGEPMRQRCRQVAISEYHLGVQAERYEKLFNDLLISFK